MPRDGLVCGALIHALRSTDAAKRGVLDDANPGAFPRFHPLMRGFSKYSCSARRERYSRFSCKEGTALRLTRGILASLDKRYSCFARQKVSSLRSTRSIPRFTRREVSSLHSTRGILAPLDEEYSSLHSTRGILASLDERYPRFARGILGRP